jgi:hypothetical protein
MKMDDVTYDGRRDLKSKGLKGLLFLVNWLFFVFLSKKLISPPAGNLDFVVKNIGTFLVALVMTAVIIHFSPRKAVIVLIPTMLILALVIAMT